MGVEVVFFLLCLAQILATCSNPPTLATGYIVSANACALPASSGSQCTISCAAGYGLSGSMAFTCQDSTWVQLQASTTLKCTGCLPGTYSDGTKECSACPSGTTSGALASSCVQTTCTRDVTCSGHGVCAVTVNGASPCVCDALYTGVNCASCVSGATSSSAGCVCPMGTHQSLTPNGVTQCQPCEAGTYSSTQNALVCSPCSPGTFSASGAGTCTNCQGGTYAQYSGSSVCTNCPQYSTSDSGAAQCTPTCPAGTSINSNGGCTVCAAGTFSTVATANGCLNCPKGRFASTTGAAGCDPCPLNYFASVEGMAACQPCASGYVTVNVGSDNCTAAGSACDPGSYPVNGACKKCPAGTFLQPPTAGTVASTSPCVPCPVGTYSATEGSVICTPCAVNTYASATGVTSCTNCATGTYAPVPGAAQCITSPPTVCAAGTYLSATTNLCTNCAPGTFNPYQGQTACKNCEIGKYAVTEGSVSCTLCAANTYSNQPGSTACFQCDAQTYSNVGANNCTLQPTCLPGTHWSGSACVNCDVGTYTATITVANTNGGSNECVKCPPGTYGANSGSTTCIQCAPGTFQGDSGKSTCNTCPVNYYNPLVGQRTCLACVSPAYSSNVGATTCVYPDAPTPAPGAPTCAAGYFPSPNNVCVQCPAGRMNQQAGAAECVLCPVGRFSNTGALVCTECANGSFASTVGATICTRCANGRYAGTGAAACIACPNPIPANSLPANTSTCGDPICVPSCTSGQECRRQNGSLSYSQPQCFNKCASACTSPQICVDGQCATPTVAIPQAVANTLVNSGVDPLSIVTAPTVTTSAGATVFVAGSSVTTVTSSDGKSGAITFGSNDGAGQQPATVVINNPVTTPQVTASIDKSVLIANSDCSIKNTTVGGGSSGSSNLIIQISQSSVTVNSNVVLFPDAAVFVSGPGTLNANISGNNAVTIQGGSNGSKLKGAVTVELVIQPDADGDNNFTIDANLIAGGNINGQAQITVTSNGNLTLNGTGQHIDSHIDVHGVLNLANGISVDANVDLRTGGTTQVKTGSATPHLEIVASCETSHTIEFTVPNVKTKADLNNQAQSGMIWTHGSATQTAQFACSVDFVAANGEKVTATVIGGANQVGPKRRLLSASSDCNTATWSSAGLNYSTCASPNSAVSASHSFFLVASLFLLSFVFMF